MAIVEVKVPELSESIPEASMLTWKKKAGEAVAADEILIEIETDKVVLEVPAPSAGVLTEIVEGDGATVVSGQVIARIDSAAVAGAAAPAAAVATAAAVAAPVAAAPASGTSKAGVAMPAAAKLLAENNLSASAVAGTGKDGRVTKGDVLGAGEGWAKSILFNPAARAELEAFFARSDSFALGVCNGCQMMSNLAEIIPGAQHWPKFRRNLSEQFEARFTMVEVPDSPSILFAGMAGTQVPVVVSHGEGRAVFASEADRTQALVAMRYLDFAGQPTETYPHNPNGSPNGITGLTTADGRFTIMMPHPERVFRSVQMSWHPDNWGENSPWFRMFANARAWLG